MLLIEPSHSSIIGWTPDRFTGYIAVDNKTVWIKVIQSNHQGEGYLRRFVQGLIARNYDVKVVSPMETMEKICIHYKMIPSVEDFDGKESIIWTMKR